MNAFSEACESHSNEPGSCPTQELLSRLGDKWSMLVILALARADHNRLRFSELIRNVSGISQRMLTSTLRYLERDGIISRQQFAEIPPRVEYSLTQRGADLLTPVKALLDWVEANWPGIKTTRANYDRANSTD